MLDWIEARNPSDLFLAAQTMGELVRGARKVREQSVANDSRDGSSRTLLRQFDGRVLPFDGVPPPYGDA